MMLCLHCLNDGDWDEDCCPACRTLGHISPWRVSSCPACNKDYFDTMARLIKQVDDRVLSQRLIGVIE